MSVLYAGACESAKPLSFAPWPRALFAVSLCGMSKRTAKNAKPTGEENAAGATPEESKQEPEARDTAECEGAATSNDSTGKGPAISEGLGAGEATPAGEGEPSAEAGGAQREQEPKGATSDADSVPAPRRGFFARVARWLWTDVEGH